MALSFDVSVKEIGSKSKYSLSSPGVEELSLADFVGYVNDSLVAITEEVLKEEIDKGFPKKFNQVTDGVVGKPYFEVDIRKKGTIDISAQQSIFEMVSFIYNEIQLRSPIDSGRYAKSHVLLYNRKEVANDLFSAQKWASTANIKDGDTIQFVNFMPYARRLERLGVTAAGQKIKVGKVFGDYAKGKKSRRVGYKPNGVYILVQRQAARKFSKAVGRIKFEFVQGNSTFAKATGLRNTFVKDGRPYLYPSIIVVFNSKGVK